MKYALKTNSRLISAVRFSTLNALCEALGCQPGDTLGRVLRED